MKYVVKHLVKWLNKKLKKEEVQKFAEIILWIYMSSLMSLYVTEMIFMSWQSISQSLSVQLWVITGIALTIGWIIAWHLGSHSYKKRGKSVGQSKCSFFCCNSAGFSAAVISKFFLDNMLPGTKETMFYFVVTVIVFACSIRVLILDQKEKLTSC